MMSPIKFFAYIFFLSLAFTTTALSQCVESSIVYPDTSMNLGNSSGTFGFWSHSYALTLSDNSPATQYINTGGVTPYLIVRDFNVAIPDEAIICGVEAIIKKKASGPSPDSVVDADLRLVRGYSVVGSSHANLGSKWPSAYGTFTYGGSSDTWDIQNLTGFELKSKPFGIAFAAKIYNSSGGYDYLGVDYIALRVYYQLPGTVDTDGDGVFDLNDVDIDNDGVENPHIEPCIPSLITFSSLSNPVTQTPEIQYWSASGIQMLIDTTCSAGAGMGDCRVLSHQYIPILGFLSSQNVVTNSDFSKVTLRFSQSVQNMSFDVYEIDSGTGWTDKLTISPYFGSMVYALNSQDIVMSGAYNQFTGNNVFLGTSTCDSNAPNSIISIHIPDNVDSVTFLYENAGGGEDQFYVLGNIKYCSEENYGPDTDGDGKVDWKDADSDDDGIRDIIEYQTSVGFFAPSGIDVNNNGFDDAYEASQGGITVMPVDTDQDGIPDYIDVDSDGDSYTDLLEGDDLDKNCIGDDQLSHFDYDHDGLDNIFDPDTGGHFTVLQDTDMNGVPDFREPDAPSAYAGENIVACDDTVQLMANAPSIGLGTWSSSDSIYFSSVNDPLSFVYNVSHGENILTWTVHTDACHSSSDDVLLEYCNLSLSENSDGYVRLFPNPTNSLLTIDYNLLNVMAIDIEDITGRSVRHMLADVDSQVILDVSDYKEGVYYVILETPAKKYTFKILVE